MHLYLHIGEKTYQCNGCDRKFVFKSTLEKHQLTHNDNEKQCNICDRKFAKTAYLERHSLVHMDERPHHCDICNKKYKAKSSLKKHLSVHTVKKLYQCHVRNKDILNSENLKEHSSVHAESLPGEEDQKFDKNYEHSNMMIDNDTKVTNIDNKNVDKSNYIPKKVTERSRCSRKVKNVPKVRKVAKTGAERIREYRARIRALENSTVAGSATNVEGIAIQIASQQNLIHNQVDMHENQRSLLYEAPTRQNSQGEQKIGDSHRQFVIQVDIHQQDLPLEAPSTMQMHSSIQKKIRLKRHSKTTKTVAERVRAYRERKKVLKNAVNQQLGIEKDNQELSGSIKSEFNFEELLIKTESAPDDEDQKFDKNYEHSNIMIDNDKKVTNIDNKNVDKSNYILKKETKRSRCSRKVKNVPKMRKVAKTGAERIREYRARIRALENSTVAGSATNVEGMAIQTASQQNLVDDQVDMRKSQRSLLYEALTRKNSQDQQKAGDVHQQDLSSEAPSTMQMQSSIQKVIKLRRHSKTAKTPAERARAYRERKKALKNAMNQQLDIEKDNQVLSDSVKNEFNFEELLIKTENHPDIEDYTYC